VNRYVYRIHYQIDPGRIGHIPMSGEEVHVALERFCAALRGYMAELSASAELPEPLQRHQTALRVAVLTCLDWAKTSAAMGAYAERHGLRATHVTVARACAPTCALPARASPGALLRAPASKDPQDCAESLA